MDTAYQAKVKTSRVKTKDIHGKTSNIIIQERLPAAAKKGVKSIKS
ncbi:hypothetical protein KIS4809_2225 [Bacillus sp. ZZV12-4809]|nr:hypothetical protein KIS4809_2225 [Bacillus sp. ZZV12-4809]